MRLADLGRIRDELTNRNRKAAPEFRRVAFEGVPGFADTAIQPETGFLAICGGTGVGKTTILELLHVALRQRDDPLPRGLQKIAGARVSIEVVTPESTFALTRRQVRPNGIASPGYKNGISLTGIEQRTGDVQRALEGQDIETLKEGGAATDLASATVQALSLICRKPYEKIVYYELETSPDQIVPYFEVRTASLSYDTRQMSSGELSAFFLAWVVSRAEPYGVVLVEEPEAYLPPDSHRAMFCLIAELAMTKRLGIVISTHSASIASELASKNLLSIRRVDETSRIAVTREAKETVLRRLGLAPAKKAIMFVEDEMGKVLLEELVGLHGLDETVLTEVVIGKDGASGIHEMLKRIPDTISSCAFVGVVDGDQKKEIKRWNLAHPVELLPFSTAMEVELLKAVRANKSSFGHRIGRTAEDVEDALMKVAGSDHHDQIKSLAGELHVEFNAVVLAAFRFWQSTSKNKKAVREFGARMNTLAASMRQLV